MRMGNKIYTSVFISSLVGLLIVAFLLYLNMKQETEIHSLQPIQQKASAGEILKNLLSASSDAVLKYSADDEVLERLSAPSDAELKYSADSEVLDRLSAPPDAKPKYIK